MPSRVPSWEKTTSPSRSTRAGKSKASRPATPFEERPEDGSGGRVVPVRLQKFLARAGVASRRGSEDLMTAGRVTVNGKVVTELGAKVDPLVDTVAVDGEAVKVASGPAYFALNKPAGYVTTMSDPHGRPTVAELMPRGHPGLFPVGRLDLDSEGLLLLTTDGDLGVKLLHPRHHVPKTYLATVDGVPDADDLTRLATGVKLDDGLTAPAEVRLVRHRASRVEVEITIREGRKRQVRRMFSAVGHPVKRLVRTRFGPIELGSLGPGKNVRLTPEQVAALREAAGE
jgi:23S rRNA pseudouridine2605 synthase